MIRIDAPNPNILGVLVDGERVTNVFKVRALWNDGPGFIWYYPRDAKGAFYLSVEQDCIAEALRFGRRIKVVFASDIERGIR